MELTTRNTHNFIEIKVDEIQTTIFNSDKQEIQNTIENLLQVVDKLAEMQENHFSYKFDEF